MAVYPKEVRELLGKALLVELETAGLVVAYLLTLVRVVVVLVAEGLTHKEA
jgi:hypothetical protein